MGYLSYKFVTVLSDLVGMQGFLAISTDADKPEVGHMKYLHVLNQVADNKDTLLQVISNVYSEYVCKHGNKFVVIEGDAVLLHCTGIG